MKCNLAISITASCALATTAAAGQVLYVDVDAAPGGDGLTWNTAYRFLQDALTEAGTNALVNAIHVGEGTYTPDRDEVNPAGNGSDCFGANGGMGCSDLGCETVVCAAALPCCVIAWDEVCAGLAQDLCTSLRDPSFQLLNDVKLRGGYAGLGAPDPDARDTTLYPTRLSGDLLGDDGPGFTGYAENAYSVLIGTGTDATAFLDGFTVTGGNADGPDNGDVDWFRGGGMWMFSGTPMVTDCRFDGNRAAFGGGIYAWASSPWISGCTFIDNRALSVGGGLEVAFDSHPTITDCTFQGNTIDLAATFSAGGGMTLFSGSSAAMSDCLFDGNSAREGAGLFVQEATLTITGCTFQNNDGGLANPGSNGGGMTLFAVSDTVVSNCLFHHNMSQQGGGLAVQDGSPTIIACTFTENESAFGGGIDSFDATPVLINCLIAENVADSADAGFGGLGGGVYSTAASQPRLVNCTIALNAASTSGGGVYGRVAMTTVTLCNSVVHGNIPEQIISEDGAVTTVTYSTVEGGHAGTGNIDLDPLFVDPANGDYRLQSGSPGIDAGDNTCVPVGITKDLDGNPRFANDLATTDTGNGECPIVDMGAYEFPASCPWDVDCDGNVGITDFLRLLAAWGTDPGGSPDIDGDGVGITDFLALLANWGPCP